MKAPKFTAKDLAPFCDEIVQPLSRPWTHGQFVYAADGRIAVRVPVGSAIVFPAPAEGFAKKLEEMFLESVPVATAHFRRLPRLPEYSGKAVRCPVCFGSGATLCAENLPRICKRCFGQKEVANGRWIIVGSRFIARAYLTKMARLPGVRIVARPSGAKRGASPVPFIFHGGEGIVMPLQINL